MPAASGTPRMSRIMGTIESILGSSNLAVPIAGVGEGGWFTVHFPTLNPSAARALIEKTPAKSF
jgi:hypothetical protein